MAAYRWMADSRVSLVPRFPFHIHLTRYTSILTLISGTWNVTHGFFIVGYVWCSTKGEAPERDEHVSMPHHLQLLANLSQGLEPRSGYCED